MLIVCVAAAPMPLLAVTTMPEYVPAAVGVPLITPVLLRLRPGGSVPVCEKVGTGKPDAV
jgi:hypothetical protein